MRLKTTDGKYDASKLEYPECHKCIHDGKRSPACLTCTAKGTRLSVVKRMPTQYEDAEPTYATSLPPEIEDKLRIAICELFQLKPLELLCLQGIMQQKTLIEIAQMLTTTFKKFGCKEFTRQHVFQLRKSMLEKMPTLKDALLTAGQHKELNS